MRRIALMNQKGGVGKTTTTVNLAVALARSGHRVCVLDLDPQAHSTMYLGVEQEADRLSIYDALVKQAPLAEIRREIEPNLTIVPSDLNLAGAEVELASIVGREVLLRDLLDAEAEEYDFILMDCPPALGVLTLNALTAANEVFVPLQPHFLALHGLGKLFETVQLVARRLNPRLLISGVVVCMYETGARLSAEVLSDLDEFLQQAKASGRNAPWTNAQIFQTRIRRNNRLAESTSFGQSIFDYEPNSPGARDYLSLAREVIADVAAESGAALVNATV